MGEACLGECWCSLAKSFGDTDPFVCQHLTFSKGKVKLIGYERCHAQTMSSCVLQFQVLFQGQHHYAFKMEIYF